MEMSLGLRQNVYLRQRLEQSFGEFSGDIPLYSLHRIKNVSKKSPIVISSELNEILFRNLIQENAKYKEDSGNDWSCLTSINLVDAIEGTERKIEETIKSGFESYPKEYLVQLEKIKNQLLNQKQESIGTIQNWFHNNYDNLLYDMSGKIPYPIIRKLRKDLSMWITEKTNPFQENINDFVLKVAGDSLGEKYYDAEEAWEAMGGKVFTKNYD